MRVCAECRALTPKPADTPHVSTGVGTQKNLQWEHPKTRDWSLAMPKEDPLRTLVRGVSKVSGR